MKEVIRLCKKAVFRFYRIITLRKGIYGRIGKGNRFKKDVLISEGSIIGNYNYFGQNANITKAKIGNYCSIAPNVIIAPGNHDLKNISTCVRVLDKAGIRVELDKDECVIGNDVWIGVNAVILRGVHLGDGAVVAAGAIVNRDVPPYSVVAGVPARIIKYRFEEDVIDVIQKSKWYDCCDINDAAQRVKKLNESIYK